MELLTVTVAVTVRLARVMTTVPAVMAAKLSFTIIIVEITIITP